MSAAAKAIDVYCRGKKWYLYLLPLLIATYFLSQVFKYKLGSNSVPGILIPFSMLDFGIHEAGHWMTIWLPSVICAAMGVGTAVLFTVLIVIAAWRAKSYFLAAISCSYVAFAMNAGGQYMADARTQRLPLVAMDGSDNPIHDWNYVFTKLHLIDQDTIIGNGFRGLGFALAIAGLLFACYLMIKMAGSAPVPTAEQAMTEGERDLLKTASPYPKAPVQAIATPVTGKPGEHKPLGTLYPTATHGRTAEFETPAEPSQTDKKVS